MTDVKKTQKICKIAAIFTAIIVVGVLAVAVMSAVNGVDFETECSKVFSAVRVFADGGADANADAQAIDAEFERVGTRAATTNLTDEQFANFRLVVGSSEKNPGIYRSSSPFAQNERATYTDQAARNHNINTVICLLQPGETEPTKTGYCGQQNVKFFRIATPYESAENKEQIPKIFESIGNSTGNTLICDNEGVAATGFISALIQYLAGYPNTYAQVDWALSYANISNMKINSSDLDFMQQNAIAKQGNIAGAATTPHLKEPLQACDAAMAPLFNIGQRQMQYLNTTRLARNYLAKCGMSTEQIHRIVEKLTN